MSQENVEIVRGTRIVLSPLSERAARRRTLDERFFVRLPAIYRRQAAAFWRATERPRLRRWSIAYSIQRGYAALNRRDYEVTLMRSDPDVEYRPSGDVMPPDLEAVFYGHDGYRKLWRSNGHSAVHRCDGQWILLPDRRGLFFRLDQWHYSYDL